VIFKKGTAVDIAFAPLPFVLVPDWAAAKTGKLNKTQNVRFLVEKNIIGAI
jgi:hypothetical protein